MLSRMIERLNEETRVHHADVDGDLDPLFRTGSASAHYMMFLIRVYGFEAPLESALSSTPGLDRMVDLKARARASNIAQDLMALGLRANEVAELPMCLTIPQFRGAAEALGWMYVSERSTLTHSVVRGHLLTCLPAEMERASSYLQSYAGTAGKRWRQFGAALDEVAHHAVIADRVISAANDAFRAQRRWVMQDHRATARAAG